MTPESGTRNELEQLFEDIKTATAELAERLGFKPGPEFAELRAKLTNEATDEEVTAVIIDWYELSKAYLSTIPNGEHDKVILGITIAMAECKFIAGYPDDAVDDLTNPDTGAQMVADNLRLPELVGEIEQIVAMMYQTDGQ